MSAARQNTDTVQIFFLKVSNYITFTKPFGKGAILSSKTDSFITFQLPHCHFLAHSTSLREVATNR